MTMERRALTAAPELRADGGAKVARGYAALFNTEAIIGGWFREKITPGAFTETLKTADVRALINHDTGRVIGRSGAGTLRLAEDERGLFVEIDLPDTTDGRDLAVQLERRDISGMSFGFNVPIGGDSWDIVDGMDVRTIHKLNLSEVSAVAFPAYADAEIALRSRDAAKAERESRETDRKEHNQAGYLRRKAEQEQRLRGIR